MASSSSREVAFVDGDDPVVRQVITAGISNEHGTGFDAEEMERVALLDDGHIWINKRQFEGIKDGSWTGMIHIWIPIANNPGTKDQHALCPNTASLYSIPSLAFIGHMNELIPEAAELFIEAFHIRDELIANTGSFFQLKTGDKKHAPGSLKNQEFDLAFPSSRKQRSKYGAENPGDLLILMRNTQTGHVQAFMPPQEKIDNMDFNDRTKVLALNSWRDQVFGRKLEIVRFDREECKMWTLHEHHGLLAYVVRNTSQFALNKGIAGEDVLGRLDWEAVREWMQENFSPQDAGVAFAVFEIDKPASQEYNQRRTLRSNRVTFERTAEEIEERATEPDIIADIMKLVVDEEALKDEADWARFVLPEPEPPKKGTQPKPRSKVAFGRVAKCQAKAKKGKGKTKARLDDDAGDAMELDSDGDDTGELPSTPARGARSSARRK